MRWWLTPQENPRGPVVMPQWVRARSDAQWGCLGSDSFMDVPPMLDLIGIWDIWRPGRRLVLLVVFPDIPQQFKMWEGTVSCLGSHCYQGVAPRFSRQTICIEMIN